MADATLDSVESDLDRAADLPAAEAIPLLRDARDRLASLADDPAVDADARAALADRVDQRLREVAERDAYDAGEMGAAMNPEDDDAP
ncbi:hypothetical protein [Salinilacihabitans rarus]|uniref:hypothetical protein n=1 Tax=Salinilacihabitans rarus TaxID=2961596 RepID=UPI0020C84AA2|nr:hypothetical protein [Salinilacihabitans rarus]